MPSPVSEYRFSCVPGCTQCCRRPGNLTLTREDVVRIAQYMKMSIRRFEKTYTERVDGRSNVKLEGPEAACPFLGGDENNGWCQIHDVKPLQCKTYPFWPHIAEDEDRWKREAERCPGIGQGPVISKKLVQIQLVDAASVDYE